MAKLFRLGIAVFALLGLAVTAAGGFIYATNTELVQQFWGVRGDFSEIPEERRKEVFNELPQRISFEREVRQDMQILPEARQTELYRQLNTSREQVFAQFKARIHAEAEIARKQAELKQGAEAVTRKIEEQLGKVEVGVVINKRAVPVAPVAPRSDALQGIEDARMGVADARDQFRDARETTSTERRVSAAVNLMQAVDKLGDELVKVRALALTDSEKRRVEVAVREAKETWYTVRQTPGLDRDPRAQALFETVPPKLSSK